MKRALTSSIRPASSLETEDAAWLMTLRSFALAISRSLWKRDTHLLIIPRHTRSSLSLQRGRRWKQSHGKAEVISLTLTVKILVKSSWDKKRRSAFCKVPAGWLHSWVCSSSKLPPSSTVRKCLSMLALHTKSLSCNWAPARATWRDTIPANPSRLSSDITI